MQPVTAAIGQPQSDDTTDFVLPVEYIPFPDAIQRIDIRPDRIAFTFQARPAPASLLGCGCLTIDVDVLHDEEACLAGQAADEWAYDAWLTAHYADHDDHPDYLDALEDCCSTGRYPR